jgi:hypothetical protein
VRIHSTTMFAVGLTVSHPAFAKMMVRRIRCNLNVYGGTHDHPFSLRTKVSRIANSLLPQIDCI